MLPTGPGLSRIKGCPPLRATDQIKAETCLCFSYQMHEEKKEEGDYKVCFSNQMSTWSDKTVYFEVEVTDPDDDYDDYIGENMIKILT